MKTVDFNVELAKKIAKGEIKGLIKTIDGKDVKYYIGLQRGISLLLD